MSYDPDYHRRYREANRERIRERKRLEYLANREEVKQRSREWASKNRERKLAVDADYRERTREQRNAYMRERYQRDPQRHISAMSAWRKANPDRYRDQYLRANFGITLVDYRRLLEKQEGVCAICGGEPTAILAVDHCHTTGSVRGLLCGGCNAGLGQFKDDPARLRQAAAYIERNGV
jgi:hypothetical protein